ncbi:MAG: leucine-rich repeat domain-containing protein [Eubacteriaceae bacterium]|nr:leucine-rich repeat domain-containing protein [Eubacteriaceae bacterium]
MKKMQLIFGKTVMISIVLMLMALSVMIVPAFAKTESKSESKVIAEGDLGSGIHWQISDDQALTISGKGEMPDSGSGNISEYIETNSFPWGTYVQDIRSVVVEDGIENVADGAFNGLNQVESADIGNSVKTLGKCAFSNCYALSSVKLPDGLTDIGASAFYRCHKLSDVNLPSSLTDIGRAAFYQCGMKSLIIPQSVTTLADWTFSDCYQLKNVVFNEGAEMGQGVFFDCTKLESVVFHEGVESIPDYAFRVKPGYTIGDGSGDPLKIFIPKSVTTISSSAFLGRSPVLYGYSGSAAETFASTGSAEGTYTFQAIKDESELKKAGFAVPSQATLYLYSHPAPTSTGENSSLDDVIVRGLRAVLKPEADKDTFGSEK